MKMPWTKTGRTSNNPPLDGIEPEPDSNNPPLDGIEPEPDSVAAVIASVGTPVEEVWDQTVPEVAGE